MPRFTDAEAAERLLNRLNRLIASRIDEGRPDLAESLSKRSARDFLGAIVELSDPHTPPQAGADSQEGE